MASFALAGMLLAAPMQKAEAPAGAPTVHGTVSAPGGGPVRDAAVVVYPAVMGRGVAPATTRTDERGRFRVAVSSTGEQLVSVDAAGFAPASGIHARTGVPVTVTLDHGRTLAGTVRDAVTGRPIPGARVSAQGPAVFLANDLRFGRREAVSDANGAYELPQVPPNVENVQASARGYARAVARVPATAARVDLTLPAGASLSGTIRSARGARLPGAIVSAQLLYSAGGPGSFGHEQTAPDGRFEIVGLRRGIFHVTAYHPGFAPAFTPPVRVEGTASIDLVLKEPATAVGRLVDPHGDPASGRIWVEDVEGGSALPGDVLSAQAGADGRFRLRDLPAGTHRAGISSRGYAGRSIDFQAREGAETDIGDVTLETRAVIRGRLRDAEGVPVAGARIQALPAHSGSGYAMDLTDATGAFVLAGLADGRYRLSAVVGGALRASREVDAGGDTIDWVLEPAGAIAGSVVDAAGRLVPAFHVVARPLGGGTMDGDLPRTSGHGPFRIDGVQPGRYALQVTSTGHADGVISDVTVTAERTTEVGPIKLGRPGTVRGAVMDGEGQPVAGAAVTVWTQRDVEHGGFSHRSPQAHTAADGSFEVGGLNPGSARVVASHPRLGHGQVAGLDVDPSAGPTVAQVVLQPGGRLRGTIRKRGQGLAATVTAMSFAGLADPGTGTLTDEDGSFVIENLPAGQAWVQFRPLSEPDTQGLPDRRVWIREGETALVEIDIREVLVTGRVTRSGVPASGLRVAFDDEGRRSGWRFKEGDPGPQRMISGVGPAGDYALLVLQPGPYTARVETAEGVVLHRRPVTVPDAAEHRLDLDFTSATVVGVLVDEATQHPIASGTVGAVGEDQESQEATTRADGRFALPLAPGPYVLHARAAGYAPATLPLEVGPAGAPEQRVALARGWSLRGRVVDARGQGVGSVTVFATADQAEEPSAHATTAADGSFELDGLSEPRCNLFAGSELAGYALLTAVGPDAGEPVLSLRAGGRVRATVADAAGAPVRGALLVISRAEGAAVFGLSAPFPLTDAAGVVEMAVPLGAVELTAHDGAGGRIGSAAVDVRPGALVPVTIVMPQGGR